MELHEFLDLAVCFGHSTNTVSVATMFDNIEKGYFILNDCDEKEIPLEVTVYKLLKGFPIHVVSTAVQINGKTHWNIVKGNVELKNILKWMKEHVPVTIQGVDASFDAFTDEEKRFLLSCRHNVISIIIDSNQGFDKGVLSADDLMELVQSYF